MTFFRLFTLLIAFTAFFSPRDLVSCMGPPSDPHLTEPHGPRTPENQFANGELGILLPSYYRAYLVVAYRYLDGKSLAADQRPRLGLRESVMASEAPTYIQRGCESAAICDWIDARKSVPGLPELKKIDPYKRVPTEYAYYEVQNCYDDAFETAARKLHDQLSRYGKDNGRVHDWTAAQDQVFENCSAGPATPQPLSSGADATASAERDYQIAAAHFYCGDYDQARAGFEALSKNSAWPDRGLAVYLAARALIRKDDFPGAEILLTSLIKNAKNDAARRRAQALLNFVHAHVAPMARMLEAAQDLESARPADFKQSLTDYRLLYDKLADASQQAVPPTAPMPAIPKDALQRVAAKDDLTAWVAAFQSGDRSKALENWKAKRTSAWLIAALSTSRPGDEANPQLLAAAQELKPNEAGYLSAEYYAAVLLERDGQIDIARTLLNKLLATSWPVASQNLLHAARMRIAPTWNDFLRDAQRESADPSEFGPTLSRNARLLDSDGLAVFNFRLPLDLLVAAAKVRSLSEHVRKDIALAAWTRSILLDRYDTAKDLSSEMPAFFPQLAAQFRAFQTATGQTQQIEALWILLHAPGLSPLIEGGFGRQTPLAKIDEFRDNWWCAGARPSWWFNGDAENPIASLYRDAKEAPLLFLSPAHAEAAAREKQALSRIPIAAEFLAQRTLAWANADPSDPRIPEALHLVIRANHYGCAENRGYRYTQEAFRLLHRRYPASIWAKHTPYWYQ